MITKERLLEKFGNEEKELADLYVEYKQLLISNPKSSIIQGLEHKIAEKERLIHTYTFVIEHYNEFYTIINKTVESV